MVLLGGEEEGEEEEGGGLERCLVKNLSMVWRLFGVGEVGEEKG